MFRVCSTGTTSSPSLRPPVGGGPDENTGAFVAVDVIRTRTGHRLLRGAWWVPIPKGSASSPAVSAGGKSLLASGAEKHILYYDIDELNRGFPVDFDGRDREQVDGLLARKVSYK